MATQFPTSVSSIFASLPDYSSNTPVPYANNNPEVSYFNPGGYQVSPTSLTAGMAPIGNNTATVSPLDWLRKKAAQIAPNATAGFGQDTARFAEGANEILDTGANSWNKMDFAQRGSAILGGIQSVGNAYNSYKAGKLAKEQFNFTKDSFNRNYEAQAKTTNAALADRQATRVARDPSAYASVEDYMKKYGV